LVGTHLDSKGGAKASTSKSLLEKIEQLRSQFSQIRSFIPVSCKSKKNINTVFTQLVKLGKAQQGGIKSYPRSYMQVEDFVLAERTQRIPPVMSFERFKGVVLSCGIPRDAATSVAEFLNKAGSLVFWNDSRKGVNEMIVLDPQWLVDLMATLISTKVNFVSNGILRRVDVIHIWHPPRFPADFHDRIVSLLECFGIVYRLHRFTNYEALLVPCLLPSTPPKDWESERSRVMSLGNSYFRMFEFNFVPIGLFSRLISGLLEFTTPVQYYSDGFISKSRSGAEFVLLEAVGGMKTSNY